mmetsp:Transcript_1607/g.4320  ORF Transcript_1607/g.4320 Transcript_1607/m.4320 type:complete len:109 (-) Transcript_1607:725-1051(-)
MRNQFKKFDELLFKAKDSELQSFMVFHVHKPNPIPANTHSTSMPKTFIPMNFSVSDAPGNPVLTLIRVMIKSPSPFPPNIRLMPRSGTLRGYLLSFSSLLNMSPPPSS